MNSKPNQLYYTPEEVAKILRVDVRTIYTWLREKKLQGVRFGRSWRIHVSALNPQENQ